MEPQAPDLRPYNPVPVTIVPNNFQKSSFQNGQVIVNRVPLSPQQIQPQMTQLQVPVPGQGSVGGPGPGQGVVLTQMPNQPQPQQIPVQIPNLPDPNLYLDIQPNHNLTVSDVDQFLDSSKNYSTELAKSIPIEILNELEEKYLNLLKSKTNEMNVDSAISRHY